MKRSELILILSQSFIGAALFLSYVVHVRSVFESRTKIMHLNQLEREALIRREDALYYSFYKTITEENDFWSAYKKLKNVTNIEFPKEINVVNKFEVLPELVIGYAYHFLKKRLSGTRILMPCWETNGPSGANSFEKRCDISSMQFYLEFVWALGGCTIMILFFYGALLSKSTFGGFYTAASYFMFHKHASKIYDRPMARENFATPFIFMHIFYTCFCIQRLLLTKKLYNRYFVIIKLGILTGISLLSWKFSGVIFAVQVLVMMLPWQTKSIFTHFFTFDFAASQILGMFFAYYFSFKNNQFIFGWQMGPSLSLAFTSGIRLIYPNKDYSTWQTVVAKYLLSTSLQISIFDFFEYVNILKPDDRSFFYYRDVLVHWLFDTRANFTTRLAACNPSYNRVKFEEIFGLVETLIIKPYCMYGVVMLAIFFRNNRKNIHSQNKFLNEKMERAKNYVLEDFLEENRISMKEMSHQDTKKALNECLRELEKVNYDYESYKAAKEKVSKTSQDEIKKFMSELKTLQAEISGSNEKRQKDERKIENQIPKCKEKGENIIEDRDSTIYRNSKSIRSNKTKLGSSWNFPYNSLFLHFHYVYSLLQMIFFVLLGLYVKKLFFLCFAEGCALAPALCSKFLSHKHRRVYWGISLAIFLLSIFSPGIENIRQEYSNPDTALRKDGLESLLEWVNMNTEKNSVFAGPVEIIGTLHLTTRRPIVNHAHLELPQVNERIEHAYSIYSRQQSNEIYNQYAQLKVQYLVVNITQCIGKSRYSCDILSIWDSIQPMYWKPPQFCSELIFRNVPSFLKVYSSNDYVILKMFPQTVQLNLKHSKMPEEGM